MTMQKLAIIVGVIIVLIIAVWGIANLTPFVGDLLGGAKGKVLIQNETITVDIANTPEKREQGLSGKNSLAKDRGMLFLFEESAYPTFWMKEMKFPIDIIFLNGNTITTIYENVPAPSSETAPLLLYKPTSPSDKVLELRAGRAAELLLKNGTTLQIDIPNK